MSRNGFAGRVRHRSLFTRRRTISFETLEARAVLATFQGLGDLPGGSYSSLANGISADGSVVVGQSESESGPQAFRWTQSDGMIGLGTLPTKFAYSAAENASADGSVIVGKSSSGEIGIEAFRWTKSEGMVGLGNLPGPWSSSDATGASANGDVVVGTANYSRGGGPAPVTGEAFRWTKPAGMVGLGDLPGGPDASRAYDVSADGSVIVGKGNADSSFQVEDMGEAVRWTIEQGIESLGFLPGGSRLSSANAVSANGRVIVGESDRGDGKAVHAFRWTATGGMVDLGDTGKDTSSFALDVSGDGSVIVGQAIADNGMQAFYWTATTGMRWLKPDLDSKSGIDLAGWNLTAAKGISADGRTIVGDGIDPDGHQQAWIATLDPAPAAVVGRHVFYNNSKFDGNDPAGGASDDAAIAPDKQPLLPGGTAAFANYTGYVRGINGIMVDIAGLPGAVAADDFVFRAGNSENISTWSNAPPRSISVRRGEGVGGSDRITFIWPDGRLKDVWLQVTVKATSATGLAAPDVFYFGNCRGESGNTSTNALVTAADEIGARNDPHSVFNPATITNVHDYNRDGLVNAQDQIIARNTVTQIMDRLNFRLIKVPAAPSSAGADPSRSANVSLAQLAAASETAGQPASGSESISSRRRATAAVYAGWQRF